MSKATTENVGQIISYVKSVMCQGYDDEAGADSEWVLEVLREIQPKIRVWNILVAIPKILGALEGTLDIEGKDWTRAEMLNIFDQLHMDAHHGGPDKHAKKESPSSGMESEDNHE